MMKHVKKSHLYILALLVLILIPTLGRDISGPACYINQAQSSFLPLSWVVGAAYAIKSCFFGKKKHETSCLTWNKSEWQEHFKKEYKNVNPSTARGCILHHYDKYFSPGFVEAVASFPEVYDFIAEVRYERHKITSANYGAFLGTLPGSESDLALFLNDLSGGQYEQFWKTIDTLEAKVAHVINSRSATDCQPSKVQEKVSHLQGKPVSQQELVKAQSAAIIAVDYADAIQQRAKAIAMHEANKGSARQETYQVSAPVVALLERCDLSVEPYRTCYGVYLQQYIHQEQLAVLHNVAIDFRKTPLQECVVDFVELSREYNQANIVAMAIKTLDIAWECSKCVGEIVITAVCRTGDNIVTMAAHPIDTAVNTVTSCASLANHVADLIKDFSMIVPLRLVGHAYGDYKALQFSEKIFSIGYPLETYITEHPFEAAKEGATMALEFVLMNKALLTVNKMFARTGSAIKNYIERMHQAPVLAIEDRWASAFVVEAVEIATVGAKEDTLIAEVSNSASGVSSNLVKSIELPLRKVIQENLVPVAEKAVGAPQQAIVIAQGVAEVGHGLEKLAVFNKAVLQDVPRLKINFDLTRKGFKEFSSKYIKVSYEHILGIEYKIGKKGKFSWCGFHHDFMQQIEKSGVVQFKNKIMGKDGVYKADVIINGVQQPKTFFPSIWEQETVIAKIFEAYDNFIMSGEVALLDKGKYSFIGATSEGIDIQIYITLNGCITTAYPILTI